MEPHKILHSLLLLADAPTSSKLTADDLNQWPENLRRAVEASAILRKEAPATWINCDQCPDGEPGEVIYLQRNGYADAYISCPICGRVPVPLERLRQYSVDLDGVARWLGVALNTQTTPKVLVPERLWDLGRCTLGTTRLPVLLARGLHWQDAAQALQPALNQSAGVLLTASSTRIAPSWTPRDIAVAALSDITGVDANRLTLNRQELAETARRGLRLRPTRATPLTTYPLPASCTFEQVQIEMVSDESVRIRLPNQRPREFDYKQIGLADRRSGKPSKVLWAVVEQFAVNSGVIDWNLSSGSTARQERLVKHVQRLKQVLQAFFETNQEPFLPYDTEKTYRCRFVITDARYGGSGSRD